LDSCRHVALDPLLHPATRRHRDRDGAHRVRHGGDTSAAESAAAIVSILGLIVTLALLPETKGLSLEELSTPAESAAAAAE
jgi:hypothetical protein